MLALPDVVERRGLGMVEANRAEMTVLVIPRELECERVHIVEQLLRFREVPVELAQHVAQVAGCRE
jgi:hypothetical protein